MFMYLILTTKIWNHFTSLYFIIIITCHIYIFPLFIRAFPFNPLHNYLPTFHCSWALLIPVDTSYLVFFCFIVEYVDWFSFNKNYLKTYIMQCSVNIHRSNVASVTCPELSPAAKLMLIIYVSQGSLKPSY